MTDSHSPAEILKGIHKDRALLGWVCGILEGEGTFCKNGTHGWLARISMTDEDVVRKFRRVVGCGTVNGPYYDKRGGKRKPLYQWSCSAWRDLEPLLVTILPFMGARRSRRITEILDAAPASTYGGKTATKEQAFKILGDFING